MVTELRTRSIVFAYPFGTELELELIQSHMAQKQMLWGEVGQNRHSISGILRWGLQRLLRPVTKGGGTWTSGIFLPPPRWGDWI